jgi:UDP-GlcNAc3NAcA epimerase
MLIEPVGFLDMIALESNASMIITDSGGVQKEAYFFEKPCLIMRDTTEWIEIVENGSALLVGADSQNIVNGYLELSAKRMSFPSLYGDGKAAEFICETLINEL